MAGTEGCFRCQPPSYVDEEVYMRCDKPEGQPCLPCKQLKLLEAEMKKTEARMKELLEEHRQMRTAINRAHDPVIGRVPQEVTSLIFQHAITDLWDLYEQRNCYSHKKTTKTPLVLAAVCKTWRDIAFDTPCLWKSIHLYIFSGHLSDGSFVGANWKTKLNIFRQWSIRAKQLPLSVHLEAWVAMNDDSVCQDNFEEYVEEAELEYVRPFIDILCEISPRLQDLTIICSGNSFDYFMEKSRMPQIRRLSVIPLKHPEVPYEDLLNIHRNYYRDIPPSWSLSFRLILTRLRMTSRVNWSQLTQIYVSYFDLDECFAVLQKCPRMTHCFFNNIEPTEYESDSFDPLIHTSLEVFSLVLGDHHEYIIDKLTLPALKSLQVAMSPASYGSLISKCLLPFIERSSCALKSLSLCNVNFEEGPLIKLFESQSSIEHLNLQEYIMSFYLPQMSFYNSLTETASLGLDDERRQETRLLPNLRSFMGVPAELANIPMIPWSMHANLYSWS